MQAQTNKSSKRLVVRTKVRSGAVLGGAAIAGIVIG